MNEPSADLPLVPAANGQKRLRPIARRRQLPASGMITVEAGKIRPVIHKTFALDEAAAAHALMESSEHVGKIMLDVRRKN